MLKIYIMIIIYECKKCHFNFHFNNKLHVHIRNCKKLQLKNVIIKFTINILIKNIKNLFIIKLQIAKIKINEYNFKN